MSTLDWTIVIAYLVLALGMGLYHMRRPPPGSRVLRLGPQSLLVAAGHQHGRHLLRRRHAPGGQRLRHQERHRLELVLVGLGHGRHAGRLLLLPALAAQPGDSPTSSSSSCATAAGRRASCAAISRSTPGCSATASSSAGSTWPWSRCWPTPSASTRPTPLYFCFGFSLVYTMMAGLRGRDGHRPHPVLHLDVRRIYLAVVAVQGVGRPGRPAGRAGRGPRAPSGPPRSPPSSPAQGPSSSCRS